jgi:CHU_C Type IX secretion signal domain
MLRKLLIPVLTIILQTQQTTLAQTVCASTCTGGNLGENIFPDGDFGSGTDNILQTDPGFAPGYRYERLPPPNDGLYTITNNTTSWGSYASTNWVDIKDNSPDPKGYMMVVNAANQPGLFFERTVSVCENTKYELSIDVISMIVTRLASTHIQSNVAFLIDNTVVCETGNILHDETWKTYRFSFTSPPGKTSVKLSLRNNAPGGFGNDLAIDNISFRACGPKIELPVIAFYCKEKDLQLEATLTNSPYNTTFYQWQTSNDRGQTWSNIVNATGAVLLLPRPDSTRQFRLVAANALANISLTNCRSISNAVQPRLEDLSRYAISGTDTIVCNGAPAVLKAGTHRSYRWNTGATTTSVEAGKPGWYSVNIITNNGCSASDSLWVFQVDLTAAATVTNPICLGQRNGKIRVGNIQGGTGRLRYGVEGGSRINRPLIDSLPSGKYTAFVVDSLGCLFKMPVTVTDPARYMVSLGNDATVDACRSFVLQPTANYQPVRYQWRPDSTLSCVGCPTPTASPLRDAQYVLTVTDALGCSAVDTLNLRVTACLELYAPNVFMPEGSPGLDRIDPQNTYFTIFLGRSATKVRQWRIFDRWGGLVYQRDNLLPNDSALRWDGLHSNGRAMPEGVYIWSAEIDFTDGVVRTFGGDVTLVR